MCGAQHLRLCRSSLFLPCFPFQPEIRTLISWDKNTSPISPDAVHIVCGSSVFLLSFGCRGVFQLSRKVRVRERKQREPFALSLFVESCMFDSSQAGVGIEIQLKLSWRTVFSKVRPKTCGGSGLAAPSLSQEQPRQGFGANWGAKGAPDSDIF